jgi:quinoprotein glucose dehydrogenase
MLFSSRGAAFWTDGKDKRLFYGTLDGQLWAINAVTGKPIDSFGTGGFVDLRQGVIDPNDKRSFGRGYGMTSPPAIYKNVVICGSIVPDSEPQGPNGDVGHRRAHRSSYGASTPSRNPEFGGDTEARLARAGEVRTCGPFRPSRAANRLPALTSSADYSGRIAKVLHSFRTPGLRWMVDWQTDLYFQTVHHNSGTTTPAQPTPVTVRRDGKMVDARLRSPRSVSRFFERTTGSRCSNMEKAVPPSEVPGESAWPTQPFPVKPAPFIRQSFKPEELTDVTPESRAYCSKLIEGAVFGTLFTPLGLKPTVLFPGTNGGANWGGASFDPETQTLFVNSMDVGMLFRMVKAPDSSALAYRTRGSGSPASRFWD